MTMKRIQLNDFQRATTNKKTDSLVRRVGNCLNSPTHLKRDSHWTLITTALENIGYKHTFIEQHYLQRICFVVDEDNL